jgi:hypothetical protein
LHAPAKLSHLEKLIAVRLADPIVRAEDLPLAVFR